MTDYKYLVTVYFHDGDSLEMQVESYSHRAKFVRDLADWSEGTLYFGTAKIMGKYAAHVENAHGVKPTADAGVSIPTRSIKFLIVDDLT